MRALLLALSLTACAGPCLHPVSNAYGKDVCSERSGRAVHDCLCAGEPYLMHPN